MPQKSTRILCQVRDRPSSVPASLVGTRIASNSSYTISFSWLQCQFKFNRVSLNSEVVQFLSLGIETDWLICSIYNLGVNATKCHICLFHLAHCANPLDCYNQPDTCSNTNFSPIHSQVVDCEHGCEQYVITDATGSIVVWRRGCATDRSPRSSYICFSRNIYFLRHEQCWCHSDYCNSAEALFNRGGINHIMALTFILTVVLLFVC